MSLLSLFENVLPSLHCQSEVHFNLSCRCVKGFCNCHPIVCFSSCCSPTTVSCNYPAVINLSAGKAQVSEWEPEEEESALSPFYKWNWSRYRLFKTWLKIVCFRNVATASVLHRLQTEPAVVRKWGQSTCLPLTLSTPSVPFQQTALSVASLRLSLSLMLPGLMRELQPEGISAAWPTASNSSHTSALTATQPSAGPLMSVAIKGMGWGVQVLTLRLQIRSTAFEWTWMEFHSCRRVQFTEAARTFSISNTRGQ